jgi:exonuclease III
MIFLVVGNQRSASNSISIFHQNICGIKGKSDELIGSFSPNSPHILCFSEHHLKNFKLGQISTDDYRLCAAHSRQVLKGGGVCIFIQNNLQCTNTELNKYCKEQDIEVCMIKLTSTLHNLLIMTVYRVPSGNLNLFLKRLNDILISLYRIDLTFIICGKININYLTDSDRKRQLDAMLLTYGFASIVHFPTRSQELSSTAIDNIFIDTNQLIN